MVLGVKQDETDQAVNESLMMVTHSRHTVKMFPFWIQDQSSLEHRRLMDANLEPQLCIVYGCNDENTVTECKLDMLIQAMKTAHGGCCSIVGGMCKGGFVTIWQQIQAK